MSEDERMEEGEGLEVEEEERLEPEDGYGISGAVGTRAEKSLGLLTQRFLQLLQDAKDGVVDLNIAADKLNVKQKRRIYDITNVLEGVGLIEKKSKNVIQWKGGAVGRIGQMTPEEAEKLFQLKLGLTDLEREERNLDNHLKWLKQSLKNVTEFAANSEAGYTTCEDVSKCFPRHRILAVQAPAGTCVEVPPPSRSQDGELRYTMRLRSATGPVHVMMVDKAADDTAAAVASQPPPLMTADGDVVAGQADPALPSLPLSQGSDGPARLSSQRQGSLTMSQEVSDVLLRLSPPPSDKDYLFNLSPQDSLDHLFPPDDPQ